MSDGYLAKVVLDSISPEGNRIVTMQLRYPRFIHGEVMTHRVFSRNAMSSRAIPVAKMIEQVESEPATFIHVGANQPGMQARAEVDAETKDKFLREWELFGGQAAMMADRWSKMGIAKQVVNRVLEPWQWMQTVVTSTEWDNFFALRCHPDAQPEFQHLATMMRDSMQASVAQALSFKQWHMPYLQPGEHNALVTVEGPVQAKNICLRLSAARCARVSYLTHDKKTPSRDADLDLFERLAGSSPEHMSPLEHQATPDMLTTSEDDDYNFSEYRNSRFHGNLVGWCQFRKFIEKKVAPL